MCCWSRIWLFLPKLCNGWNRCPALVSPFIQVMCLLLSLEKYSCTVALCRQEMFACKTLVCCLQLWRQAQGEFVLWLSAFGLVKFCVPPLLEQKWLALKVTWKRKWIFFLENSEVWHETVTSEVQPELISTAFWQHKPMVIFVRLWSQIEVVSFASVTYKGNWDSEDQTEAHVGIHCSPSERNNSCSCLPILRMSVQLVSAKTSVVPLFIRN